MRPSSVSKLLVNALRARGAEIRVGDCIADPPARLAEYLQDADVLLSTINAEATLEQKLIIKAAVDADHPLRLWDARCEGCAGPARHGTYCSLHQAPNGVR